jgi:chromosomal replication initiator protein
MELTRDDMDIVSALLAALVDRVGKERFELWFGPRTRIDWDGQVLTIGAPNQFFLDWIRANFRTAIEEACLAIFGRRPSLEFRVEVPDESGGAADAIASGCAKPPVACQSSMQSGADAMVSSNGNGKHDSARVAGAGAAAHACRVARQAEPSPTPAFSPPKFASLSSFVVGASNRLAMYSAEMVARNPGQITPLFVYGPTSVGKTHLLEGIWSAERKAGRGTTTVYLSAEQFTSQFLEALRGGGLPVFRRKYRGVHVLIVDDLQFLAGKRATQIEMMHTVDTLLREGRQLVFAADRPPVEFSDFMPELTTRLTGGMVCRIDLPDYTTRLGIVGYLSRRLGIELPADVQRFVASRLTGHARELSGAICRLQATSEATRQNISVPLAEEALGEMIQHNTRVVRLTDIEKAVCKVFGLEPQTLQSDGKTRRVSQPRMMAMWLARKHTRAALSEIGAFFGRRSHSTVISAQKRIDQWMAHDEPFCMPEQTWKIDEAIRQVERQLTAG